MLRYLATTRLLVAMISGFALTVAVACGGDAATPTSPPTATSLPTATSPAPTATAPTTGVPTATSPAMVAATATAVPDVEIDQTKEWVNYLLNHPGYKPEWGTPQYGGIIKWAGPRAPSRWVGSYMGWGAFASGGFQAYNSLLMQDPWLPSRAAQICDLCESFEVSADGLTYTFQLHQGVKFAPEGWGLDKGAPAESYGAELTCEDVRASMEWLSNPPDVEAASFTRRYKTYWGHFANATCPDGADGYTVIFEFSYFRAATMSWLGAGMQIWNKEYREWMDTAHPGIESTANPEGYLIQMGTGPFIPTSADNQSVVKVKKNPNYFREGAPFADGYEFFFIPDYNTKFASLLTGKVHQVGHGSSGLTKAQVAQVQNDYADKVEMHPVQYNHIQVFMLNPLRPPFDDWNVRWAVNLALDRGDWLEFQTVKDVSMASPAFYFHPAGGWSIPVEEFQTFPGFNPATKDQDIAEANRILDETFGSGVRPRTDQYVIQLLSRREPSLWGLDFFKQKLGWEFDVKYLDSYGTVQTECTYTIRTEASTVMENTISAGYGDALGGIHSERTGKEDCYIYGYKGTGRASDEEVARIDAMIEEADSTLDLARRAVLLRELELYMGNERLTSATLGTMNPVWATLKTLSGVKFNAIGTTGQWPLTARTWLNN